MRYLLNPKNNKVVKVVTFGAPLVIAHEPNETEIDPRVFRDLLLHVHNYIFSCDIVPRLLGKGISKSGTYCVRCVSRLCAHNTFEGLE